MNLVTVKKYFDEADLTGVANFKLYYVLAPATPVYTSPFVAIPVVAGQTAYEVDLPTEIPGLAAGTYNIGISAINSSGDESDIDVISVPLVSPPPPKWRR